MQLDPVVIIGMARTPQGNLLGALKDISAPELGATAISAAIGRAGLNNQDIDEVFMGCVLTAGLGQAPARQAALKAGIPPSTGCTTTYSSHVKAPSEFTSAPIDAIEKLLAKTHVSVNDVDLFEINEALAIALELF